MKRTFTPELTKKIFLTLFICIISLSLKAQPVCNASFVHYSVHNPDIVHFYPTGNNASGTHYYWDFGDGDTSTSFNPWHYYASTGKYYACLTVTDSTSSGTCHATKCDTVYVNVAYCN